MDAHAAAATHGLHSKPYTGAASARDCTYFSRCRPTWSSCETKSAIMRSACFSRDSGSNPNAFFARSACYFDSATA